MIRLTVWLRTPAGERLRAGELRVSDPDLAHGGRLRGEFRYEDAYLADPRAIALDPLHLPLAPGVVPADRPHSGIHGVFEDSLPDAWGRGLLIRQLQLPRTRQRPAHLLAHLGDQGLGALVYTTADVAPLPPAPAPMRDTTALIDAARRYDTDPAALDDDELAALFRAASSPGGARPKLLITDRGTPCIAKLGASQDRVDLVRVEAACLALGRDAGLAVPAFRVAVFGRHTALLVARFDLQGAAGRRHLLSMQTLLGADGWYQLGYADLADGLRRVSARPELDLPALYRQAIFNALLGNTDDHLKNFTLLHGGAGWRLSPAYDLTPDEPSRGEHVLHFGTAGHRPNAVALVTLGQAFGLSAPAARRLREEVTDALAGWRQRFADYGVSAADTARLAPDLEARFHRCTLRSGE